MAARSMECSHCGNVIPPKNVAAPKATRQPKENGVDTLAIYKVLKGRGYDVSVTVDALDPSAMPVVACEPKLQPLIDILKTSEILSTTPKVRVVLGLDEMMALLKLPERK